MYLSVEGNKKLSSVISSGGCQKNISVNLIKFSETVFEISHRLIYSSFGNPVKSLVT